MTTAAISRFESELLELDACVERAGAALGCCYSTAEEFEAERIADLRSRLAFARYAFRTRVALMLTAAAGFASLLLVAL